MDKHPSFPDRAKAMQAIANNLLATANLLTSFSEEIAAEADRMTVAAKRFAERRTQKASR